MKQFSAFAIVLFLSACASVPGTREVNKPVTVPCLLEIPTPPTFAFEGQPVAETDDLAAHQVRVLWLDREAAMLYATKWEVAAAGCQVIPQ